VCRLQSGAAAIVGFEACTQVSCSFLMIPGATAHAP
jgi:hypothetical protein